MSPLSLFSLGDEGEGGGKKGGEFIFEKLANNPNLWGWGRGE